MTVLYEERGYQIDSDPNRLDLNMVHHFLATESYWAKDRSQETVKQSIENSFCLGVYDPQGIQIGFARVITDWVTFAWLCDLFIVQEARGQGWAKKLVTTLIQVKGLDNLKRMMLSTRDAHGLYSAHGNFQAVSYPGSLMERKGKTI